MPTTSHAEFTARLDTQSPVAPGGGRAGRSRRAHPPVRSTDRRRGQLPTRPSRRCRRRDEHGAALRPLLRRARTASHVRTPGPTGSMLSGGARYDAAHSAAHEPDGRAVHARDVPGASRRSTSRNQRADATPIPRLVPPARRARRRAAAVSCRLRRLRRRARSAGGACAVSRLRLRRLRDGLARAGRRLVGRGHVRSGRRRPPRRSTPG